MINIGAALGDGETLDHPLIAAAQSMYRTKSAPRIGPARLFTHESRGDSGGRQRPG